MADNRLRTKAMGNYWAGLGLYTGEMTGEINNSPENRQVINAQKPNPNRVYALKGKVKYRKLGR